MTPKSDTKLNKLRPCSFKNGMYKWVNVHQRTPKFENLNIGGLFLFKAYNVSAEKFQRDYVMKLKQDAKFKGKPACGLKTR